MRYALAIAGLLLVVGGLVAIKFKQISSLMAFGKTMQKAGPPPEAVATTSAQLQSWEGRLTAVGTLAPVKGVAVSNDAAGVVTRIAFESGATVKADQVLVELDTRVERAQLASAEARRDLARTTLERNRTLMQKGVISRAELDPVEAQYKTAVADSAAIDAQIARKTVRAPFAGRLGIRAVNLGQYLNPGTPITVLESAEAVYVDFTVPQQRLADVKVGLALRVASEGDAGAEADGVITAIDPTVDEATRTVKVRASVPNKDGKLRPGMFANVTVILPERGNVVTVPATAVIHASYGDSVFVVEAKTPDAGGATQTPDGKPIKTARQQFVRVGQARGDFVSVLDGVEQGQSVVSAGGFKLRNGAPVVENNAAQPTPQLAPQPENH